MTTPCSRCKRPLRSEKSMKVGMGASCLRKSNGSVPIEVMPVHIIPTQSKLDDF